MSDNKKYYYLKLKENFFDSEEIKLLEAAENGYLYSNILLKMYLKSLKTEGRLMFRENIPYNEKMLSVITGHNIDIIKQAINVFIEIGLVQQLDSGAIYLADIQSYIGESSTEADRKREYRLKIDTEKQNGTNVGHLSGHSSPEIELELNTDKELKLERDIKTEKKLPTKYSDLFLDVWNNVYPHGSDKGSKERAYKNWLNLLKDGCQERELASAASNYRKYCDIKQERYKYKCSNFYGEAKYYDGFIIINEQQIIDEVKNENNTRTNKPPTAAERAAAGVANLDAIFSALKQSAS